MSHNPVTDHGMTVSQSQLLTNRDEFTTIDCLLFSAVTAVMCNLNSGYGLFSGYFHGIQKVYQSALHGNFVTS